MNLTRPVPENSIVTQTFAEHVQRAKQNGWCSGPGNCPGGVYYYGGIDYGIPIGTPIVAPMAGRVEVQNQGAKGYGLNVRIAGLDGYYIILAHLDHTSYKTGQDVSAGNVVALSDNTGNSTGPHLHLELRHNGIPIDPMPYLKGETEMGKPLIPPITPELRARVTCDTLNVRNAPAISGARMGTLTRGTEMQVYETKELSEQIWVRINKAPKWVALWYARWQHAEFFSAPVVKPPTTDLITRLEAQLKEAKDGGFATVSVVTGDLQDVLDLAKG